MIYKNSEEGYKTILEGITIKTLVYGDKSLLTEFRLKKGSRLPLHTHPHEQTGYMIAGHIKFSVGGEIVEAKPGDSWCIPGGVEHDAEILEDSKIVEIFSPVREDYLAYYSG
jgi:quercetin dioxygenase-like cupin family protein